MEVWLEKGPVTHEKVPGTPNDSRPSFPGQWCFFNPENFLARLFLGFCKRGVEGGVGDGTLRFPMMFH